MTSAACFLHHNALTTPARSPSQCYVAFKPAVHVACRVQKQSASEEEDGLAVSRRLALSLLVGAVAISSRISPADAAYGEAANVFGKPKTNTDFPPYNGNGFTLLIPSKWNPSKEVDFPGQVLRYEDNFDRTSNVSVIVTPTDKKSITNFGSPEHSLSQVDYLLGKQAYSGKTDTELSTKGGFESDAVAMANILESAAPVIDEKLYYFISVLMRTVDSDEGGKHQLINAADKDGKLFICKAQAGDKRQFKGARKFIESTANSFRIA